MFATRTSDLMRFRAGELPAGNGFAGTSVAAEIDGGQRTEFYNPFRRLFKKGSGPAWKQEMPDPAQDSNPESLEHIVFRADGYDLAILDGNRLGTWIFVVNRNDVATVVDRVRRVLRACERGRSGQPRDRARTSQKSHVPTPTGSPAPDRLLSRVCPQPPAGPPPVRSREPRSARPCVLLPALLHE
jgi:hypothetical protein